MLVLVIALWTLLCLGLFAALVALPRWCVRSVLRHQLWRLRDELFDDALSGAVPIAHPAVRMTIEGIETATRNCHRFSMVRLGVFTWLLGRSDSSVQTAIDQRQLMPPKTYEGLDDSQRELVQSFQSRLVSILTLTVVTATWLGLATLLVLGISAKFHRRRAGNDADTPDVLAEAVATRTGVGRADTSEVLAEAVVTRTGVGRADTPEVLAEAVVTRTGVGRADTPEVLAEAVATRTRVGRATRRAVHETLVETSLIPV